MDTLLAKFLHDLYVVGGIIVCTLFIAAAAYAVYRIIYKK